MFTAVHLDRFAVCCLVVVGALTMHAQPAAAVFGKPVLDQTGCQCFVCPSCRHTCELKAEVADEEQVCFDVEEKVICIPRVVFPWQKPTRTCHCSRPNCSACCHQGARTRTVRVLTTEKYKCPQCQYRWSPKEIHCVTNTKVPASEADDEARASVVIDPPDDFFSLEAGDQFPWSSSAPVISQLPATEPTASPRGLNSAAGPLR